MIQNARVKKISNTDELIFDQLEEIINEENMNDENDETIDNAIFDVDIDWNKWFGHICFEIWVWFLHVIIILI